MNEQATQTADDATDTAPSAVDETLSAAPKHKESTIPNEETVAENPLAGLEDEPGAAPEELALHSEASIGEAALETADIAQVMEQPPEGRDAAEAPTTRNRGMRWYIIHAYTGFEHKVANAILEEAGQKGLSDYFEQVVVPSEEIVEIRRGKKVQAERKLFPGYVLAKMQMTDATWQLVRSTDKVAGFLGGRGQRPQPISEAEASAIFAQVQEGIDAPKRAIIFDIGEQVKIIDGPFDSFIGTVEDIDENKEKLKVSVSIFGRPTPVELDFGQVEKA